jgi:ABC-2 type transport system ATP-binding protein
LSNILSIQNLSKIYGAIQALKGVSFDVPEGSVYGVLGPNGSGKTTLLCILLNVLMADAGTYSWFGGMPPDDARRQIGALLETPNFYQYMSAYDNLEITASIRGRGLDARDSVLQQVGLYERRHSKFQEFSLGMKQRLAIGAALL